MLHWPSANVSRTSYQRATSSPVAPSGGTSVSLCMASIHSAARWRQAGCSRPGSVPGTTFSVPSSTRTGTASRVCTAFAASVSASVPVFSIAAAFGAEKMLSAVTSPFVATTLRRS